MFNEESLQAVGASRFTERFGKPLYTSYGFAQIPATILTALSDKPAPNALPEKVLNVLPRRFEKVILILLDAFGWRFLERVYDRYPFLRRIAQDGVISKLTTQFPSTTSAHVTTINTGLPVGESGVFEWFMYEPTLDAIIAPLLFSFAGDDGRNTLRGSAVNPRALYPRQTVYKTLDAQGVKSFMFQPREFSFSPYNEVVGDGGKMVPYRTLAEALTNLVYMAEREPGRAYFYLYYDGIDSVCHQYGPDAPQTEAEIDLVMTALERIFHAQAEGRLKNTLLLLTADHGQTSVSPESTIYLNHTLPALRPLLRHNLRKQPLVPAGSPRDMFLYIAPGRLEEAQTLLRRHLEGRADVCRVDELMAQGFFGPTLSDTFRGRIGDLVILPYAHETVWWYEHRRFEMNFLGMHGGLDREEMETHLLALAYS